MAKGKRQPALVIERVALDELRHDPRNTRLHSEKNIAAIAESLRQFGQQKPIVATSDGMIVAGNGTLEAMRRLGWTHCDVSRTALAGHELSAYGIVDNHSGDHASYDRETLEIVLADIGPDLRRVVGFDFEVAGFVKDKPPVDPIGPAPKKYCCPKCGHEWTVPSE